ncbi:MAG: global cell cycle regulator GcrA-like protein [Alphaproteobacteria bacterium]|nr:global cell cycle regulator GcrA-like protein [Alphaproteobacteria bacterium]
MGWTDEQVEELKRLWDKGLTTGEIGKALGVSKNAVVGKAHRLGLNSRPSPIRRGDDDVNSAPENTEKATAAKKKKTAKSEPAKKSQEKEKKKLFTVNDLTSSSCRWPIGDPKDEDFHFCGKEALPDKPYCAEHAAIAYVSAKALR